MLTYGQLSDNFKKFFPDGNMAQNGFGLIRGTDTVYIKELKIDKEADMIPLAHVSFDMHRATVHNVGSGLTTFHEIPKEVVNA